ncbi:hypothetical protein CTEN210_00753 [Chaetoceros tenuissimus]|uniref:TIR domain-containing protein n=1 Tax=Chaetoceros tenuissimus TaxID=426638 RepID=A0AAD3CG61_9STRA|nr:hypothetical protein CTEN210_00753 [Chaetoceros tenuissimus]
MRMYMERTAWNTFIIPIKGHLIFIVTFIFSIALSYFILILFDLLKEIVKKKDERIRAAHEDGIKLSGLDQVINCSSEHAATCEASDIRTEVKMTTNPNEADSIVQKIEVNTNEGDTSTKTMGNCASEDATSRGSGIRQERMAWNPNEADVVIDTKKDVKPTEATSSLLNSNASTSHENVKAAHETTSSPANLNEAAAHETIPFPKNGIKLSYLLNDFVKECGGRRALKNKTTTQVCDRIVKRKTNKYGLSYCDMILEKSKTKRRLDGVVKTATVFISHAWKYKFLDVLDALEDHFKNEPDKIVWFDLVSNNQHKAGVLPYEWWATTFKDAIEQLGHTVMVMAPWNDPIPYKRAWCIFEAYCTSVTDAKFEIAMSNNEHRAFIEECKLGSTDVINKMLSIVNAEKSEAWNPMDKERIHSVI